MKTALAFVRQRHRFKKESDEWLIWQCLVRNLSFKLDRRAENDVFIGFKEFFRVLKRMIAPSYFPVHLSNTDTFLLYYKKGNQDLAVNYVERSTNEKIGKIIWKGSTTGNPYSFKDTLIFFVLGISISVRCMFYKVARSNRALVIRDVYETDMCVSLISTLRGKKIYDFLPYEKDANLTSYLLRKKGMKVIFIPSVNPLRDHNHVMIADEIVLVTPYQQEERNLLYKSTIRCNKILKWIPEAGYTYIDKYIKLESSAPQYHLGFYSHGSWARNQENHLGSAESLKLEEWVLQNISQLLIEQPQLKVLLFLHPKEKRMNVEDVLSYYKSVLGDRFEVAPLNERSVDQFEKVDIGVASYSSIVYERLFTGHKMIVGSLIDDGFPLKGSTLENVYFRNYSQFKGLVLDASSISRKTFFEKNNLNAYHFSSYEVLGDFSNQEQLVEGGDSREENQ
jgi:hypothetical protein